MPKPYFSQIPDFEYTNRTKDGQYVTDFTKVKNLFKRAKLREDIFQNTMFFEKYQIEGDDRPDNVAKKIYDNESLDWVILLSNNIINVQNEWPISQAGWDAYLLEKYDNNYDTLYNGVHHYESNEVKNTREVVIFPKGLTVGAGQSVSYYDETLNQQITVNPVSKAVTNYEYEDRLNAEKRGIFILKGTYLNIVFDDIERMMGYKKGSTQFISRTLKRADNIRLYD
jgi:hypothetical protein